MKAPKSLRISKNPWRFALVISAVFSLGGGILGAQVGPNHDAVEITRPWTRATPRLGKTAAVYLTLANKGAEADRLVGASSPAGSRVSVHESRQKQGVMTMHHLKELTLAPGEKTVFAPGGLHFMIFGLKAPLQKGGRIALTLEFKRAGLVEIMIPVLSMGARAAPPADTRP